MSPPHMATPHTPLGAVFLRDHSPFLRDPSQSRPFTKEHLSACNQLTSSRVREYMSPRRASSCSASCCLRVLCRPRLPPPMPLPPLLLLQGTLLSMSPAQPLSPARASAASWRRRRVGRAGMRALDAASKRAGAGAPRSVKALSVETRSAGEQLVGQGAGRRVRYQGERVVSSEYEVGDGAEGRGLE